MKKRVSAAVLTLCVAGTLAVGPAATPASAATCDELTQVYCTTMGIVCYALYRLHVIPDPACIA